MKHISRLIAAGAALGLGISLVLVSNAFAAPLNWPDDATVTINSHDYTIVSGSAATSITVGDTTLTVSVPGGSTFSLKSSDRYLLTNDQNLASTCTSSSNTLTVPNQPNPTVVITPNIASTCTVPNTGGGGGGGGGTPPPATPPAETPPAATETPSTDTGTVAATPALGGETTFTSTDAANPSLNVSLPANAVTADTTVSVSNTTLATAGITVAVSTAGATGIIGSPYSITATSSGSNVSTFGQSVTLTFTYTDAQLNGASPADMVVMYFDTSTSAWVAMQTTVNTTTHTITTTTLHFTVYVVANKPGAGSTVVTGTNHANGTLINDNGTFYLISNGQKIGFRDAKEYASYGYNFGQAVAASAADKGLAQASVAKAMEGTLVLDAADNKTVYMIGTGSTKRGFVSAAVFKALGYSFANLPKINLTDYPTGAPIGDANLAHPDGSLVFEGKTIWWLRSGKKTGFETMVVFNTYGFSVSKVLKGNTADFALAEGSIIKFRDGTLVKDGSTYYLISDGKKLSFASATDLTTKGYKTSNAISASLAPYTSGGSVQ